MRCHFVSTTLLVLLIVLLGACTTPTASPTRVPAPTTGLVATVVPTTVVTGKLNIICTVADDWCVAMTQAFENQTGSETTFIRLSSGEALEQLRSTQSAPEFDLWHGGPADGYVVAKNEGLLQPYESPSAVRIPDLLKDPEHHWTGAYVGALGFCANTDRLAELGVEVPHTWAELLDPRLKVPLAMAHPATSGTAYTALWTKVILENGDTDKALAYFKQLY
ncbi:MAG: extracellular solute-binding protein, partial [Ardenticatenales bacterium]|nr:extracellular solute-binding protein [Ardenticatenales bacterium]